MRPSVGLKSQPIASPPTPAVAHFPVRRRGSLETRACHPSATSSYGKGRGSHYHLRFVTGVTINSACSSRIAPRQFTDIAVHTQLWALISLLLEFWVLWFHRAPPARFYSPWAPEIATEVQTQWPKIDPGSPGVLFPCHRGNPAPINISAEDRFGLEVVHPLCSGLMEPRDNRVGRQGRFPAEANPFRQDPAHSNSQQFLVRRPGEWWKTQ